MLSLYCESFIWLISASHMYTDTVDGVFDVLSFDTHLHAPDREKKKKIEIIFSRQISQLLHNVVCAPILVIVFDS